MTKVVLPNGEFSDDGTAARDMRGYGYMEHLLPLAQGQLMVAAQAIADRGAAAASAGAAAGFAENAAGYAQDAHVKAAQTILDRSATGEDRIATGQDRTAVAEMLGSIADGPVTSVNGQTGPVDLTATDIAPAATPAEMAAGTETGYRSMSPVLVAAAAAAKAATTGDLLVTARNPGAGWLSAGAVYLRSAYTALFAQVGLIKDQAFGDAFSVKGQTNATYGNLKLIRLNATTLIGMTNGASGITIWRSLNNAAWVAIQTLESYLNIAMCLERLTDTSFLVAGGSNTVTPSVFVLRYTNSGDTLASSYRPTSSMNQYPKRLRVISATRVYAFMEGYASPLLVSTDGGANFTPVTGWLADNSVQDIARISDTSFFALTNSGQNVGKTVNSGSSFTIMNTAVVSPIGPGGNRYATNIFALNATVVFLYDANTIAISRDGGVTWQKYAYRASWNVADPANNYNADWLNIADSGFAKFSETAAVVVHGNIYWSIIDTAGPQLGAQDASGVMRPFIDAKPPQGFGSSFMSGAYPLVNSSTEILLASSASTQFLRTSLYSYDETTQFKTPSVAGLAGAAAYIKA